MDEIKWLEVAVNTTPDRLDEVTAKLTAAGMTGLVIEDEGEFQQFLEQNRQYWDYVDQELMDRMRGVTRVKFYVTDDGAGRVQLEQYTRGLDAEYTVTPLTDNDWAYSWQKYYKPLEVGRRLYVVPEWMRDEPVPEGRSPLYLNPGLTFGTGSHASTQLCLEGVEEHTLTGRPVLDLGCGSGILSIAALCLVTFRGILSGLPKAQKERLLPLFTDLDRELKLLLDAKDSADRMITLRLAEFQQALLKHGQSNQLFERKA